VNVALEGFVVGLVKTVRYTNSGWVVLSLYSGWCILNVSIDDSGSDVVKAGA